MNNKERAEDICQQVWDSTKVVSSGAGKYIAEELNEAEKRGMEKAADKLDALELHAFSPNLAILIRQAARELK